MRFATYFAVRAPIRAALALAPLSACQHSLANAPAQHNTPAAASTSAPVVSVPGAPTPAPAAVACPKPAWSTFLQSTPEGSVGRVLLSSMAVALSANPDQPPHLKWAAAPALVMEGPRGAAPGYYRLLGADGSSGWARLTSPLVNGGVAFENANVELADQIVEPMQQLPDNLQIVSAGAAFATIVGASGTGKMEETWQLGAATWLDTTTVPWLRVKSSAAAGWLAPSATRVVWQVEDASLCNPFAGLAGLVRGAFLTRARQALRAWLPPTGATVRHVLEDRSEAWAAGASCELGAALFPEPGQPPRLVVFDCDRGQTQLFSVSSSTSKSFYTISDEKRARLFRFEFADLTGDESPELILELGLRSSDDYESALLVLPVAAAQPKELAVFGLGQLSDDVDANWLVSAKAREIGITRTSARGLEVSRVSASADGLRDTPGYAAVFGSYPSVLAAQREALSDARRMVFPLTAKRPQRWASGSVFSSQREACEALAQAGVSAQVRRLAANRMCANKGSTSK